MTTMGTTVASAGQTTHAAGIYADMTLDGPEIGTLVVILDRAKNLPNRKTMGKQNPYCAARLGKEARKTATDMRGGQTPKWDQELRFTVHDSPDYNNLKLSVFNDDKKTDLIGETWIDLTAVLRPGGGQSDQWHGLNCKGRYAGEIRIELTYYDSRPKFEKRRDRAQIYDTTSTSERPSNSTLGGPRQPQTSVRRRPLPGEPIQSQPNPVESTQIHSTPESGPGHYDDPHSGHGFHHHHYGDYGSLPEQSQRLDDSISLVPYVPNLETHSASFPSFVGQPYPLAGQNEHVKQLPATNAGYDTNDDLYQEPQEFDHGMEDYMPVTDDPYALQAVEIHQDHARSYGSLDHNQQPRHARVQALSETQNARPPPSIPLPHAHSAPLMNSLDQVERLDSSSRSTEQGLMSESLTLTNHLYRVQSLGERAAIPHSFENAHALPDMAGPPPPPVHRNSAPVGTRLDSQSTNLTHPTIQTPYISQHNDIGRDIVSDAYYEPNQAYIQTDNSPQQRLVHDPHYSPHLERRLHHQRILGGVNRGQTDANPVSYQTWRQPLSAQPPTKAQISMPTFQPMNDPIGEKMTNNYIQLQAKSSHENPHALQNNIHSSASSSFHEMSRPQGASPPLVKPRAISPRRQPQPPHSKEPQWLQQSPGSFSTTHGGTSSVPFSPDSFAIFNPRHSQPTTPTANESDLAQRRTSPRFSPRTSTSPQPPSQAVLTTDTLNDPIIGSDGRIKDPSDHLPPSSYAPEPERKVNRPSTVVTVRNRFGPRQAPTLPVATRQPRSAPSSPLVATNIGRFENSQQTSQRTQQAITRPMAQSPPGTSNMLASLPIDSAQNQGIAPRGYGYDRVEMFGPPVPRKIPLDASDNDAYDTGTMQLASNLGSLSLNRSEGSHAAVPTRVRKSRWGA